MKAIVYPHKIDFYKQDSVNEKEVNITKVNFEFVDIPNDYVKEAYFTKDGVSYKQIIVDNVCDIPSEVLDTKGQIELGVVAYNVENETLTRYNPRPIKFLTIVGSLKDEYENTEPITPTDKEQIMNALNNIDLDVSKEGDTTTISLTNTNGQTKSENVQDGADFEYNWQGTSLGVKTSREQEYQYVNLKGDKGDPGAITMIIVNELPEIGDDDTIYLVPITPDETDNNYKEYIYVNGQWELLGKIGVQVDLTDYVKNTDYATSNVGGVIKVGSNAFNLNADHKAQADIRTFENYSSAGNNIFIGKGTLENVITGKGLVSNTNYADNTTGGVIKVNEIYSILLSTSGALQCSNDSYSTYQGRSNNAFISKGTLENVLTNRIGDIETALDLINGESVGD